MELKPGYKQTEVGVIPEDWTSLSLKDAGQWKGGATPSSTNPHYWLNGDIPWASSGDIKKPLILDTLFKITPLAVKQTSTTLLPLKSIVLVTRSGILRKHLPVAMNLVPIAINQDLKALLPYNDVSSDFMLHALTQAGPHILATCLKSGTTVESLEFRWLKAYKLACPCSVTEQQAIATALSDVDALLAKQDQLLAKKRNIKQATMQELLTGKRRLPGFSGEWAILKFGGVVSLRKTKSDSQRIAKNQLCIDLEHIEQGTGRLLKKEFASESSSIKSIFLQGDVLFGKLRAYLCKYWLATQCGICSTEIWVLVANKYNMNPGFLFQFVRTSEFIEAASSSYGTHMPRSDWSVVKKYEAPIPHLHEQAAIAAVLSDMDAEIDALEAQREKTRALKQGMMQELLTGRIRLVPPAHAHNTPYDQAGEHA